MAELHLFIVWEKGEDALERILGNIRVKFAIVRVYRVQWEAERFAAQLSRFYGKNLPAGCHKEKHCGKGPFTLIVVRDESPQYGNRVTLDGKTIYVNTNMFDAKSLYRKWTGWGHRVHATNSPAEANHDLALLFGYDGREFEKLHPGGWSGTLEYIHDDLVGMKGWKSIRQMFEVLNQTIEYVVLRNFECLPDHYHMGSHGDIDLLTNSLQEMRLLSCAEPVSAKPYRVLHRVLIAGKPVLFDFRHVGDQYYDSRWESEMLGERVSSGRGFYVPNDRHYFYSLLYHAAVHKKNIADDYRHRLCVLAERIGLRELTRETQLNEINIREFLRSFMEKQGYSFIVPQDKTVYFNKRIAQEAMEGTS